MFKMLWKLITILPRLIKSTWKFWGKILSIFMAAFSKRKKKTTVTDDPSNQVSSGEEEQESHEPYTEPPRDYSLPQVLQHDVPSELDGTTDET